MEQIKVRGRGGLAVTALVSLVRFALEQETILAPFSEKVNDRFERWMSEQRAACASFSDERVAWLEMHGHHIAASITVEREDLGIVPFNQRGGLGKASEEFGERLYRVLKQLCEALAA